jgi:hypothetical protein
MIPRQKEAGMVDTSAGCWRCNAVIHDAATVFAVRVDMRLPDEEVGVLSAGWGTIFCVDCAIALVLTEVEAFLREPGSLATNGGELQERIERVYPACQGGWPRKAALAALKELRAGADGDGHGA